jgi:ABC-2 type transport system ATP-binding protein
LEVRGLSAGYGKRVVISGIDFALSEGEVFGLIGLNGAGKTTLIKAILGLGQGSGHIAIYGHPAGPPRSRAKLAYLPEKFQPSALLRGWEFITLTLDYFGLPLDRDAARAMCAGLDLDADVLERNVRTYSKGMGQKLGLVGTLLTGLPLLILDEPMSGLDPKARIMLKDRLLEYRDAGHTVFFSSHILADIEEICGRIGVIHNGALIFLGTPEELVARNAAPTLERAFLAAIERADRDRADPAGVHPKG